MKQLIKKLIVFFFPLSLRKWLVIIINRQTWLDPSKRYWWSGQLISDFAEKDVNAYHKFLWRYHLSYAESYKSDIRFGYDNLNETRKIFLSELTQQLQELGLRPDKDITSIFEVGCSLGYLLHYMETTLFPGASIIEGNDIDKQCIDEGNKFLASQKSKINLIHADMEKLEHIIGDRKYDLVFGAGVLLYLKKDSAEQLVAMMMRHTKTMLAISALAHPDIDNAKLDSSTVREQDKTWIHNVDKMVADAGGKIVARRWEGGNMVDGNTIYFVFAIPPAQI